MRFFSVFLSLCFLLNVTYAQFQVGLSGSYFNQNIPEWETTVFGARSNEKLLKNGFAQSGDLKIAGFENYRIQFHINAGTDHATTNLEDRTIKLRKGDLSLITKAFLLSLEADCDCPTFSREAGLLEKGFYMELITGMTTFKGELSEQTTIISEDFGLTFNLGIGMGIEIGINDYVTVSPFLRYRRHFNLEWENLQEDIVAFDPTVVPEGNNNTAINQISAGIRLGLSLNR